MFRRFKIALALAIVMLVFGGGTHIVTQAASVVDSGQKEKEANTQLVDESFYKFYQQLLKYWNQEKTYRDQDIKVDLPKNELDQEERLAESEVGEKLSDDEKTEDTDLNSFEKEVVRLTNIAREKNGLTPLQIDQKLSDVARLKSQDMADNRYFAHQSPRYGSPFDMMKSFGVTYKAAGENIARGQGSPEEVVNGWMNSPGHRANILNSSFTHIGVGFVEDGKHWTQQFIGK